jgi:hypothetical protein
LDLGAGQQGGRQRDLGAAKRTLVGLSLALAASSAAAAAPAKDGVAEGVDEADVLGVRVRRHGFAGVRVSVFVVLRLVADEEVDGVW